MSSEQTWKLDALVRLWSSIALFMIFGGGVSHGILRFVSENPPQNAALFFTGSVLSLCAAGLAIWMLRRPFSDERLLLETIVLFLSVLLAFVGLWVAARLLPKLESTITAFDVFIGVIAFQGGTILFTWRSLREQRWSWSEAFGLKKQLPRSIIAGIAVTIVFLPIGWALQVLSVMFMEHFNLNPQAQSAVRVLESAEQWHTRLLLGIGTVILAPLGEEVLFRGLIYPALKRAVFRGVAMFISSLGFALIHGNLAVLLPLFAFAIVLTLLYEWTDNLLAPVTAHMLFNSVNFILLYTPWFQNADVVK